MLQLLQSLLGNVASLSEKARAIQAYDQALAHHSAKEYKKAYPLMKEAADAGHLDALLILADMYLWGKGCTESGRLALECLERSAARKHAPAYGLLGMALVTGKAGIPRDMDRGQHYLELAAAEGDDQSRRMLDMIGRGEGMFRGNKKAPRK